MREISRGPINRPYESVKVQLAGEPGARKGRHYISHGQIKIDRALRRDGRGSLLKVIIAPKLA
jgi:hypothetical protein